MRWLLLPALSALAVCALTPSAAAPAGGAAEKRYMPSWDSIDRRPLPAWFDEAKFGIFIHWGLYSVPAWGPKGQYAEWYWSAMQDRNGPTWKFHEKTYGAAFRYQDFVPQFRAELFQPESWADLFARSGSKYVVLTSKHHEGFCLWPSAQSWNWNSVDVGPHRDLVGDLSRAVRDRGLKMGYYYSLYEWFHPLYRSDPARFAEQHMLPQLKDLIERYRPSILFTDGEWEHPSDVWRSAEFLAWLYNESPVRDEIVVNDRWGKETRSRHGGYYTTEYGEVGAGKQLADQRKWEENRGIGASFGYNRNEDAGDYKSGAELVPILVETVARGGNLLLDVGPTADGRIPVIMQQRLLEIGAWLGPNGEAIYGSRPWRVPSEGKRIWYTAKGDAVYALCLDWPGDTLTLEAPRPRAGGAPKVTLLGWDEPLTGEADGKRLRIRVPAAALAKLPGRPAYVFRLSGVE